MRPDSRTSLERASWVTSVRTRREDRSLHRRLILSQTSAGNSRETRSSIISLLHAVPLSVPGGRSFVPACGREDQADQDAVALVLTYSKARPLWRTAQAMRASLFASAIASTLWCSRCLAASIHDLSPYRSHCLRPTLTNTTQTTSPTSVRRYQLPGLDMLPRTVRSPVGICFATSPSQPPKSRPFENGAPVPIAATIAVEMSGPMPGIVISRSQPLS